jgi:uncharacterized protein
VKAAFEDDVAAGLDEAYTWPVSHCGICRWEEVCEQCRRADDHLSIVAGMRRTQAAKFAAAGMPTLAALARPRRRRVPVAGVPDPVAARLGAQARLQLEQRTTGEVTYELVEPVEEALGLCLLPPPSAGDVFFDMEGDPFAADDGLEYLFGLTTVDNGKPEFLPIWAHDKAAEKRAFEAFVDLVVDRQRAWPDLHIYHYGSYEPSTLKRLMSAHGTREREIDALLRGGVFVDLYTVVRQGVRVSQESYGLKALEPLYMAKRAGDITSADSSIVAYEEWLHGADPGVLDAIAAYNRLDCESTWRLREWLEERRIEAEARTGAALARPEARDGAAPEGQAEAEAETAGLVARLTAPVPDDPAARAPAQRATWLLAQILDWHRREARPEWWAYFARRAMAPDQLLDDAEALAGLRYDGVVAEVARSRVHRYRFPTDQEHKIIKGRTVHDPATGRPAGTVERVDSAAGVLDLRRGVDSPVPHPAAVIPGPPIDDRALRRSIARVAQSVADHGIDGVGPYRAVRDALLVLPPRMATPGGGPLVQPGEEPEAALRRLVLALDGGCLPVQGPPGTGKTWAGARAIVDLVRAGRRVGVTATSHKVIGNLLDEVSAVAAAAGVSLRAMQRADGDDCCTSPAVECVDNATIEAAVAAGDVDVVAGTPWPPPRRPTCPATWSSSSASTGSTWPSPGPGPWPSSAAPSSSTSGAARPSRWRPEGALARPRRHRRRSGGATGAGPVTGAGPPAERRRLAPRPEHGPHPLPQRLDQPRLVAGGRRRPPGLDPRQRRRHDRTGHRRAPRAARRRDRNRDRRRRRAARAPSASPGAAGAGRPVPAGRAPADVGPPSPGGHLALQHPPGGAQPRRDLTT